METVDDRRFDWCTKRLETMTLVEGVPHQGKKRHKETQISRSSGHTSGTGVGFHSKGLKGLVTRGCDE